MLSEFSLTPTCRIAAGLLCAVLISGHSLSAGEEDDVSQWIDQLGAKSFAEREAAEQSLIDLGWSVRDRLRKQRPTRPAEWQIRADRVLNAIEQRQYSAWLEQLRESHLPDDHQLVAWARFSEQFGDTQDVRNTFSEIQESEIAGFVTAAFHRDRLPAYLQRHGRRLGNQVRQSDGGRLPVESYAALLMLLCELAEPADQPLMTAVMPLMNHNAFRSAVAEGSHRELLKTLFGWWLEQQTDSDEINRLMLSLQLSVPEGVAVARRIDAEGIPPMNGVYVLLAMARFGRSQDLERLEELLDDATRIGATTVGDRPMQVQIRDAALAGLILRAEADPARYGMEWLRPHPLYLAVPGTIGFPDEATRREALRLWRQDAKVPASGK